jgi:broad specificity phosphatase PhoE
VEGRKTFKKLQQKRKTMGSKIYLVRHAEAQHNVDNNFNIRDPLLTATGVVQAVKLSQTFPDRKIPLIISSSLQRAIQTTILAFPLLLDKRYFEPQTVAQGHGITGGAELIIDPDLQERSDLPCDTGSSRGTLESLFPRLDLSTLPSSWPQKVGPYAPDDDAVRERAAKMRRRLRELVESLDDPEKSIIVVTHGTFMQFLTRDDTLDLPKATWRAYRVQNDAQGNANLVPVE